MLGSGWGGVEQGVNLNRPGWVGSSAAQTAAAPPHAASEAEVVVSAAVAIGAEAVAVQNARWWAAYWPQSFLSLGGGSGSTKVQQHYWTQLYRFPVSDRTGTMLGIIGSLGPTGFSPNNWNSDYYSDMNQELMYWLNAQSNRPELSNGLETGWGEGSSSLWMLHNSFKQWAAQGNEEDLVHKLCPQLLALVRSSVGRNHSDSSRSAHWVWGADTPTPKLHIHGCSSPEYGCFAPFGSGDDAEFPASTCSVPNGHYTDCGFALGQMRWGLETLLSIKAAAAYNLSVDASEAEYWQQLVARDLAPFASDNVSGYRLSAGCRFACPHRHFSHLLQVMRA